MTDAEIDALMPEQLRIEVAVQVMRWRWMKYPAPNMSDGTKLTGLYPPDAPGRWPCSNHYYRIWEPSDEHAERFSNWENVIWWDDEGAIMHRGLPDYPNDIAAAFAVVEKLFPVDALSLDCIGYNGKFSWHARFRVTDSFGKGDTVSLAICRAALKAVERRATP